MTRTATATIAHRLQFALFRVAEGLVQALPWRTAWSLGQAVGWIFYRVDARHRRVVRDNIRRSGLGLAEAEVEAMSRACFKHFGALLFTTLRLLRTSPEDLRRITRIEGREHLEAAFAEGRGGIAISGHFGNWELSGLALSLAGWPMAGIGRELDNPLLEAELRAFRTRFGNILIPKDGGVRGAIKALKSGKFVGFMLDQDALTTGVFVRFLGNWASTFPTAGILATRFDLPILPVSSLVQADGTLTVTIHPPFHAPTTGDPARDAWTATQLMTTWIETQVRRNPCQWFWMHRRFKTQPGPGEPDLPPVDWQQALESGRQVSMDMAGPSCIFNS